MTRRTPAAALALAVVASLLCCNRQPDGSGQASPTPTALATLPPGRDLARVRLSVEGGAHDGETIYLYAGDYLLGSTPPGDQEFQMKEDEEHDFRAVVATPDNRLAPFYAQTKRAAVRSDGQQTVRFKIPELWSYDAEAAAAPTPPRELPQCSDSDGEEVVGEQARSLAVERTKLTGALLEAGQSALLGDLYANYSAATNSPPTQNRAVFTAVPVWSLTGNEPKSQELQLTLTADQVRQLGGWIVKEKLKLEDVSDELKAMSDYADQLMARARDCRAQKGLDAAYFEKAKLQESAERASYLRRDIEAKTKLLADALERAGEQAGAR
ncbi:MAG: hypothetical protein ABR563_13990 [Pyrinomonadaceae bacterium]